MALYQLFYFINVDKAGSSKMDHFSWPLLVVDAVLCKVFFDKVNICSIQKFFSRFWFSLQSQLSSISAQENWDSELPTQQPCSDCRNLSSEEVEMVMGNFGLFCSSVESEKLKDSMGFVEISLLFDEKEPSLEEIKVAFDVFDKNKDGFIDAEELQRVLGLLGLKEGTELHNCRNMIRPFDDNKDGRIDFNEFVKFMESTLS